MAEALRRYAVVDLTAGRTVAVIRVTPAAVELAAVAGQHVPGTAYHWRHGWEPLNARIAERYGKLKQYAARRDSTVRDRGTGKGVIRRVSDSTIGKMYDRWSDRRDVTKKLASELDRRDRVDRAAKKLRARRGEHRDAVHAQFLAAEADTRGNLLNREGRRAGINPQDLFTGPEARAHKYASEELLKFWDRNPRLTAQEFLRQQRQSREAA